MLEPLFNKVAGLSHFLIKLETWRAPTVLKRGFNAGVFQWNLQTILRSLILKNIYEATASEILKLAFFRKLESSGFCLFGWSWRCRSNHPEVNCQKDFPNNFAKLTGKHLCRILFFNKVAVWKPTFLLKKRLQHRCFPVNLCEMFKNF